MRKIADILVPESYNKEKMIDGFLKIISEGGPEVIGLKMRMIYKVLKRCYG